MRLLEDRFSREFPLGPWSPAYDLRLVWEGMVNMCRRWMLATGFVLTLVLWSPGRVALGGDEQRIAAIAESSNPSQVAIQMMDEVKRRERELAIREDAIRKREEKVGALEAALSETIKAIETKSESLKATQQKMGQEEESMFQQLAKLLESSPPEQGAKVLGEFDLLTAARVLSRMNSRKAGRLLALVEPKKAASISQALVKRPQ
jgi:flagellar motility protein MotE (MotC chaperone)